MKNILKWLIKGIYAGVLIGMGGVCFLAIDNKIVGSFLFSLGLLTVCMYQYNLYTGKVGYVINNKLTYIAELLISLLGNFIGAFLVGFLIRLTRFNSYIVKAQDLVDKKLNDNLLSIFILAIFCGILMYIAVNNFKTVKDSIGKYIGIFLCVMAFILCGFEHCIANAFYFSIAGVFSLKVLLYILIMVLGNSVGSIVFALYDKYVKEK